MEWKTLLAYIPGNVDQELFVRNEYLVAENRILRNQIQGRVRLTAGERITLAKFTKRLGRQALAEVFWVVAEILPLNGCMEFLTIREWHVQKHKRINDVSSVNFI